MRGYTTDYVNLIADNLRDRYDNGFPILKELIQNADDAKARQLIFGRHPGFPGARQPLMKGPGLWFFNDGEFRRSDASGLRSFGIGSKAGSDSVIGKFGLGMKSVFHLCEALFYAAWDGRNFHREGLTPWKQDNSDLHKEWDETSDADWNRLKDLALEIRDKKNKNCGWFLLWLPLRMKRHLQTRKGEDAGAIVSSFPGDNPAEALAFLDDATLAHDVAEMLPLLRRLERVEHRGEKNSFTVQIGRGPRLMWEHPQASGEILLANGCRGLAFSGRRRASVDADGRFSDMQRRDQWPRTRYRDEFGREREAADKASPEGAVVFCSGRRSEARSRLCWAVFLPVDDGGENFYITQGELGHSLILHGQFFLDAGRKKIHDHDCLHRDAERLDEGPIDENLLRRTWNQKLAQDVVLPLVLPTLKEHVERHNLSDDECHGLTAAMSSSAWFGNFRKHICRDRVWLRALERNSGPRWRLVEGEARSRLRPVPRPPASAPARPWSVFPELAACNIAPYDAAAPRLDLADAPHEWQERELERLLSRIDGLFVDAPSMDYLTEFLETCANSRLSAERIQHGLLRTLRRGLGVAGLDARRRVAAKTSRLIGFLQPEKRLELADELPESILRDLWKIDAPVLLVPRGMGSGSRREIRPDKSALAAWLRVLDRALGSPDGEGERQPVLRTVRRLLETLPPSERGRFLRAHRTLRVIGAQDARSGVERPVSVDYLDRVRAAGCLFRYTEGLREAKLGIAPYLAGAMPGADIRLVNAESHRVLFSEDNPLDEGRSLPMADDGQACLAAVGRYAGRLGDPAARLSLLERANDPGWDMIARRGLRFLLHGSVGHRDDDEATLWIGRRGQHPAWRRLWTGMHKTGRWSLVDEGLADAIPPSLWSKARIAEIDAQTLIDEIRRTGQGIEAPEEFSEEEREEILSRIEDEDIWRRLPLHTAVNGRPVSAAGERVYLAPDTGDRGNPLAGGAILIALSRNPTVANRQKRWLPPWDERARIEVALATEEPARHWRSVMDALNDLPDPVPEDMRDLLRSARWLPTAGSAPINPDDVIDLQGASGDEAHRLVAEHRAAHGACFAVPVEVDAAIQGHAAWPRLREAVFASGAEGFERLGLLLEDLPNYRIGKWTERPGPDAIGLLGRCTDLPGFRLLEMASDGPFDPETAWTTIGPALAREIDPKRLAAVLDWLSGDDDRWDIRKSTHDFYLRELAAHDRAAEYLPRLRLASADRRWRKADELCAGAPDVARSCLLDTAQEAIIGNFVRRTDAYRAPRGEGTDDFQQFRSAVWATLRNYFAEWEGHVQRPLIGVVLALLGPYVREMADEFLRPHSFEWLVGKLPWRDPDKTGARTNWMGWKGTVEQATMAEVRAGVRIEEGKEAVVLNLLGDQIRVALDENPDTLLAGDLDWRRYDVIVPLRRIDPDSFDARQLGALLRATAEWLYSHVYNQKNADFSALWRELARSDQLEIGIARRLILDHIPFYLRQLSVNGEKIREYLNICDSLRRRIAEGEADGQSIESVRKELHRNLDTLAGYIDRSPDERQAIVQALRRKIGQYQYDYSSIPFELFQNADDAAVEMAQYRSYPSQDAEVPDAARRFIVDEWEGGLRFLHWGRPINARGPVGFDGERRGYDRDLEKMLILSASDKLGNESLTGKFGLGFKSVLLASEQPRILSDQLAVRIVAGILPQPWEDCEDARQRLNVHGADRMHPGTLIELPGVERELRSRVLTRFRGVAGVLCVFGRAIRKIVHVGASESSWSWAPREICPNVEVGELHVRGDWGACTGALCVRARSGSLLVALGPQGVRPLPDEVPALWVTAPTGEASSVGFAVNGDFELDAGRGRLAAGSGGNLEMAKSIGSQAGDALGGLLKFSHRDWRSVRACLGLASDIDPLDFWASVWSGLTRAWLTRRDNRAGALAWAAALATLARLCRFPSAIPNGLAGALRRFSNAGDIRYELTGVLSRKDVSEVVGKWARFADRYPAHECVSKEIGSILREADLRKPQPLRLSALVGALERHRVRPDDANVLGRLWLLTEGANDWESDDLRERLDKLLFRSEAGGWIEADKLLATRGRLDSDEPQRHELAPDECRLHADYYTETDKERPAIAFFLLCRRRMVAPAETLARWVLDAASFEARRAAFRYLARGELGERVGELVRGQGWLLRAEIDDPQLTEGFTDEEKDRLRRRLIATRQLERAAQDSGYPLDRPISSSVDLATALKRIHRWWSSERVEQAAEYRHRLYPAGVDGLDLIPDPDTGQVSRPSWFTLLALASFQGMGRTREEQHRGFIQRCEAQGWWAVFTDHDPKESPEKWMDIIEEYAEEQHDDEEWAQWIGQFPKLYRLRRWLDDYVELFLSIDRFEEPFTLAAILSPRSNPRFQGGGVDAPPLTRTLRVGAHLVVRELLYHGAIGNPLAAPHAYAPITRVRNFFRVFRVEAGTSKHIHGILKDHLGKDGATFGGDYDIPLRIVSSNPALRDRILNGL